MIVFVLPKFQTDAKRGNTTEFKHKHLTSMICMTFNFPLMLTLSSWIWSKQHHKTDLSNISEERILTSLPHWERKYQPILSHRKFAKRLCLFQLTDAQRTQRKKMIMTRSCQIWGILLLSSALLSEYQIFYQKSFLFDIYHTYT